MAKIRNKTIYPLQNPVNPNDHVIGTDVNTGETKNFSIAEILSQNYDLTNLNPQCLTIPIRTVIDSEGNTVPLPYQVVDVLQAIINKICNVVPIDVIEITANKTVSTTTPILNQNFVYTITVENTGNIALTNVVLIDLLPSEVLFIQSNSVNYNPLTGQWVVGDLAPGDTLFLNITVTTNNSITTPGQPFINSISSVTAAEDVTSVILNNDIEVIAAASQNLRIDAGFNRQISLTEDKSTLNAITRNTNVSFLWEVLSGGTASIQNPTALDTLVFNIIGDDVLFSITMTDNINGNVVSDTVRVIQRPFSVAQNPSVTLANQTTSLTTVTIPSAYSDPNSLPDPQFQWVFVSIGSTGTQYDIVNENAQDLVVENLLPGIYIFKLTVTNTNGYIGEGATVITVT